MLIFLQNKYTKWYFSIIETAKLQNRPIKNQRTKLRYNNQNVSYFEDHHIIPKCFGGQDIFSNIMPLTAREHYICHLLLTKMTTGKLKYQMITAFTWMAGKTSKSAKGYNSKLYDYHRQGLLEEYRTRMKENNPTKSLEVRQKISKANKGKMPHNHFNGWDDNTKKKISQTLTGRKMPEKQKEKLIIFLQNKIWICHPTNKSKHIQTQEFEIFKEKGWTRGRKWKKDGTEVTIRT